MNRRQTVLLLVVAALTLGWAHGIGAQHQPAGELIYAMHVTLAPAWFDPAENGGLITPFAVVYTISPFISWRRGAPSQGSCRSLTNSSTVISA
jgi:hypothetical protein